MAGLTLRFLSAAWFESAQAGTAGDAAVNGESGLVLEQVVPDTPDGEVVYRVEVRGPAARIVWPIPDGAPAPDLRITSPWETAVAVARGELSTQRALMQGRLRVSGNPARMADAAASLAGVDPVPADVRADTSYN